MSRAVRRILLAAAIAAAPFARAGGVDEVVPTVETLWAGDAAGIAISTNGELFLAPRTERLEDAWGERQPLEVWSLAVAADGTIFAGTGPDGEIFRLDARGRGRRWSVAGDAMVTALYARPGGGLIAGTSPGGKLYRIDAEGRATLWSETGERYVWAIAESAGGNVYLATGGRGRLLRIRSDGTPEVHFDAGETHLVDLVPWPEGGFLAGGGGAGRVYLVDVDGNGLVLYDDELDEARGLRRAPDGGWYVALLAAPPAERRAPQLQLRLPQGATAEPGGEVALADADEPTLRGVIEGLRETAVEAPRVRGRLVRLDEHGGDPHTVWESTAQTPLALATDARGRLLVAGATPAALLLVGADGTVARAASFSEGQVTALARAGTDVLLATSNPAALYRVGNADAEQGDYLSPPADAGSVARWGAIRWRADGRLARTEVYSRTGNSPRPDETWSAWSAAQVLASGSPVDLPLGRWAQWRVRFVGGQEPDARLRSIRWPFERLNRAPRLREAPVFPFSAASRLQVSWAVSDPDDDPVTVVFEHRKNFGGGWTRSEERVTLDPGAPEQGAHAWNLDGLAEGAYDVRLAFSDAAGNAPGEGLESYGPAVALVVDRTPPVVTGTGAGSGRMTVVVTDTGGRVERVELLRDGVPAARLRSEDGVCDGERERFSFAAPTVSGAWSLRARDAAGNETESPLGGNGDGEER